MKSWWFIGENGYVLVLQNDHFDLAYDEAKQVLGDVYEHGEETDPESE